MNRDELKEDIIALKGSTLLLELSTGTGKSKLALDKIQSISKKGTMLIVVPRNVLKESWAKEINQWFPNCKLKITMTTYASLHKYAGKWDFVIFDEAHHLSERCRELIKSFTIKYSILLSATVSKTLKESLAKVFGDITIYKRTLRETINDSILPDPKVYLIPLTLKSNICTEVILKNKASKKRTIECNWIERWNFIKQKEFPVKIHCTEQQYHQDLCNQIDYWKRRYNISRSSIAKNKWLRLCGERLKWLSDKKIQYTNHILKRFINNRTLTFCNNIEQTETLGKYCINSKNVNSTKYLKAFNDNKINHITACNMLNEGCNLSNCQIGIFNNLNSSETIIIQRIGRILRHKNPIIIIPFYKGTREEELVNKMIENYNPKLIKFCNIEDINI